MTRAQIAKYWKEWRAVVHVYPDADDDFRYELHRRALEELHKRPAPERRSSRSLTNSEFTAVLAEFWAITKPADVKAQMRQIGMARTNLIWSIQHRSPEAYWRHIAMDRFGCDDLEQLSESQLVQLRNTLAARASQHRRGRQAREVTV